jgi:hypothetical protein
MLTIFSEIEKVLTKNIAFAIFVILLAVLGYIDYLTSDYSLALFYILYVVGLTWYTDMTYGVMGAFMATISGAISDYYTHFDAVFQPMYYWNWFSNFLIFTIISISVAYIKRHHIVK